VIRSAFQVENVFLPIERLRNMLTVKDARKARVAANEVYRAAIKARNAANDKGDPHLYCELADIAWQAYINRKRQREYSRDAERAAKQAERRTYPW
jgi:hypothetical protein